MLLLRLEVCKWSNEAQTMKCNSVIVRQRDICRNQFHVHSLPRQPKQRMAVGTNVRLLLRFFTPSLW